MCTIDMKSSFKNILVLLLFVFNNNLKLLFIVKHLLVFYELIVVKMSLSAKRNQLKLFDSKQNDFYTNKIQTVTDDLLERVIKLIFFL